MNTTNRPADIKGDSCLKTQVISALIIILVYFALKLFFPNLYDGVKKVYFDITQQPPLYTLDDIQKISRQVFAFVTDISK
ncbi:MAG: hypothetical protein RSD35_01140 [Oscillospiraceae bacterium]